MKFELTLTKDPRDEHLELDFVGPDGYDGWQTSEWTLVGYHLDEHRSSKTYGKMLPLTYFLSKPGVVPHTHGLVMHNTTHDESFGEVVGTWRKVEPDINVMCDYCNRIIEKDDCFYCRMVKQMGNLDRNGIDFVAVDVVQ